MTTEIYKSTAETHLDQGRGFSRIGVDGKGDFSLKHIRDPRLVYTNQMGLPERKVRRSDYGMLPELRKEPLSEMEQSTTVPVQPEELPSDPGLRSFRRGQS